MKEEITFTVKTTKGFRSEPPEKQREKIKITSSVYDVFKDFKLKNNEK